MKKGAYSINVVDEVTQWQAVGCVQRINENHLIPLLEGLLEQFPFIVRGAFTPTMAANSSTIKPLNCSRSCELNLRSLARAVRTTMPWSKPRTGAVVRKWMGYQFLPSEATQAIDTFYRQWLNPYLNFHRPCAFASERRDRRGKLRKVYAEWSTPWEKLLSLPAEQRGLRRGSLAQEAPSASGHLFPTPSLPSNSTLSATNCNASAKDLAICWRTQLDNAPTRGVVGSSQPTSEDGRGVSAWDGCKGGLGCRPFPLMQSPSTRPTKPQNSCSRRPQLTL